MVATSKASKRIVGAAVYSRLLRNKTIWLFALAVHAEARRTGIGSALVLSIMRSRQQFDNLIVTVDTGSISFYERPKQ